MAISQEAIADAVELFIRTEYHVSDKDRLFTRGAHLFELGFVDSVGFTELIAFLETHYAVALKDEQLFDEKFTSINGISEIVWSLVSPCRFQPESPQNGAVSVGTVVDHGQNSSVN